MGVPLFRGSRIHPLSDGTSARPAEAPSTWVSLTGTDVPHTKTRPETLWGQSVTEP